MTIKECISAPLHHAGYSLQVVVDGVVLLPLLCLIIPNTHHVRFSFSKLAITSLLPRKTPVRSQSLKEHKYPRLADGLESKRIFPWDTCMHVEPARVTEIIPLQSKVPSKATRIFCQVLCANLKSKELESGFPFFVFQTFKPKVILRFTRTISTDRLTSEL
jgi:hypothetical protein